MVVSAGTQTITHQLVHGVGYTEIPITPAKLKNEDGSYIQTVTDTYNYVVDEWVCTNHCYESVETAPSCTEDGYVTYTCKVCGDDYVVINENTATDHNYDSVVTPPTCSEEGYTTHTCLNCGDSFIDSKVETCTCS